MFLESSSASQFGNTKRLEFIFIQAACLGYQLILWQLWKIFWAKATVQQVELLLSKDMWELLMPMSMCDTQEITNY